MRVQAKRKRILVPKYVKDAWTVVVRANPPIKQRVTNCMIIMTTSNINEYVDYE